MKIRCDFITNSSSMCYVLDKSTLTVEELKLIRENSGLAEPSVSGLSRISVFGEEADVVRYLKWLEDSDTAWGDYVNPLVPFLKDAIDRIGEANILFIRSSDENMGGRVENEALITARAVARMEYH